MSYINDALKKAQEEKDSLYAHYQKIIRGRKNEERTGEKAYRRRGRLIVIAVAFTILIFGGYFIYSGVAENRDDFSLQENVSKGEKTSLEKASSPPDLVAQNQKTVKKREEEAEAVLPAVPVAEKKSNMIRTSGVADPSGLYKRALQYQKDGNNKQAEQLYRNILTNNPTFTYALNNLGVILMGNRQHKEAESLFLKAFEIKDNYVDPVYNLACLYSQKGDFSKSLKYLEKAIELKNDVKKWAENDKDLERLRNSIEFYRAFRQGEGKVSRENFDTYIVKEGEWLFDIIRRHYGVSTEGVSIYLKEIRKFNPEIEDSNIVYPGQKLLLPSDKTEQVNLTP